MSGRFLKMKMMRCIKGNGVSERLCRCSLVLMFLLLFSWQTDDSAEASRRIDSQRLEVSAEEGPGRESHSAEEHQDAHTLASPPKSIICAGCHISTLSVNDPVSIIALVLFLLGILSVVSVWLSGTVRGEGGKGRSAKVLTLGWLTIRAIFSPRLFAAIKVLLVDVVLLRRLFKQSPGRWLLHGLLLYPLVIRSTWGIVAGVMSIGSPDHGLTRFLLDEKHPFPVFLFDVTGLMMILGGALAMRRKVKGNPQEVLGLPRQDYALMGLLGAGVLILGYVMEGIQIAVTGTPPGSEFAFLGYGFSRLIAGVANPAGAFVYVWYGHAVLTGIFIALLPFSRMFHMLMAPVVAVINAGGRHGRRELD